LQIPAGYVWQGYNGNPAIRPCPTWECSFAGHNWYAMYYSNPGWLNGYQIYRKCLRIGTESALAVRGYFNGRVAAPRVAKREKPVRRRSAAAPEVSLSDL
jgi:hypothetical protein